MIGDGIDNTKLMNYSRKILIDTDYIYKRIDDYMYKRPVEVFKSAFFYEV